MGRLAVIGAGAKASALAAKCGILHSMGKNAPELVIFESDEVGAAWSGDYQFTDGAARICTPIDRDLGFPYSDPSIIAEDPRHDVNSLMMGGFSWRSFLADESAHINLDPNFPDLNSWLSKGCPHPTHSEFSEYLKWSVRKSCLISGGRVRVYQTEVTGMSNQDNQWSLQVDGGGQFYQRFDGVVVTGNGERVDPLVNPPPPLLFNGCNFWDSTVLESLNTCVVEVVAENTHTVGDAGEYRPVVALVGHGGTATAIASYLTLNSPFRSVIDVHVYGSNPFFDSRPENFFSDRFYSTPEDWRAKPPSFRRSFLSKTVNGRVWKRIIDDLQHSNVTYEFGHARNMTYVSDIPGRHGQFDWEMTVSRTDDEVLGAYNADIVVDARGFDACWFISLLAGPHLEMLAPDGQRTVDDGRNIAAHIIDSSFELRCDGFPRGLHVPNLGEMEHAAATNLMALGSVADCILAPYRRA